MKKSLKIFAIIIMAIVMVMSVSSSVFATDETAADVMANISASTKGISSTEMQSMAGRVLGFLQIISAIAAVILIAYLGFKMILGSANEKADVQKQFIPLIIGVVIVFAATSIAKLLLGIMGQS